MNKFCLPLICKKCSQIIEKITANLSNYDYFEIWLDYIEDTNNEFLQDLVRTYPDKLIFLFRRLNLEGISASMENRQATLVSFRSKPVLFDLDVGTQREELEFIKKERLDLKLISSYHNYEQTPETSKLYQILDSMDYYAPTIYKIACFCRSESDALRLSELALKIKNTGKKFIVTGMGEFGKITRINSAMFGNEMIFAPLDLESSSAAGQITLEKFKNILKNLE